jgi:hypothetical protein
MNGVDSNIPTIRNAEDAFLEAKAQVETWAKEFNGAWYKPQVDMLNKVAWGNLPEDQKNKVRLAAPSGAKNIETLINKQTGG